MSINTVIFKYFSYYLEEEDDWNVNIDDLNKSYA